MEEWYKTEEKVLVELYQATKSMGGTISGEHGIGSKRKSYMNIAINPTELALMKKIKEVFDPNNIMNPGKIFDLE